MRYGILFMFLAVFGGLSGCMTKTPEMSINRGNEAARNAAAFFHVLDKAVCREGKTNALGSRVKGFPYLRTNRFFTGLKFHLDTPAQQRDWVAHMQAYDLGARISEIRTLSGGAVKTVLRGSGLKETDGRDGLVKAMKTFSAALLEADQTDPDFYDVLIKTVASPDEYSSGLRVMGLYPLAYGPVLYFTKKSYERMAEQHKKDPSELEVRGRLVRFAPQTGSARNRDDIRAIFSRTQKDSLGIYAFRGRDLLKLAEYFAPVYIQDTAGRADHPGTLAWDGEGRVAVDETAHGVYYYFTYALVHESPVLQINYVNWYPERSGPSVPWYEKGRLDGFNFRVTLDSSGDPMVIDIVHNCGCYHFLVPGKARVHSVNPTATETGNQVPAWIPPGFPEKRIALRISSGWHQIQHIGLDTEKEADAVYELLVYQTLEALPSGPDSHESIFDENGIVKGTGRLEVLFLFPAGVPDIGAMRQRTRQPTRLIGKEHFDNPQMLETYFDFTPQP